MLSNIQNQQLLDKVVNNRVKRLSTEILQSIADERYATMMEQATMYLVANNIIEWPLVSKYDDMISSCSSHTNIPNFLKIIIFNMHNLDREYPKNTLLYMYKNGLITPPKCKMCDTETKWSARNKRFNIHCGPKCKSNDPIVSGKRRATSIARYGHDTSLSDSNHTNNIKATNKKRYGVSYPFQSKPILQSAHNAIDVQLRTDRRRNSNDGKSFGNEMKQFADKQIYNKSRNYWNGRISGLVNATCLSTYDDYQNCFSDLQFECTNCNTVFVDQLRDGRQPRCTTCKPYQYAYKQQELVDFIHSVYKGTVLVNDRSIICPMELDVYLPDIKLAFEFNGLYWHSEIGSRGRVDKNYHLHKTNQCKALGIDLLHIFEDTWNYNREAIESIIATRLGLNTTIYARSLTVREISSKDSNQFASQYHVQGARGARHHYGLFDGNTLMSIMTFGSPRFSAHQWEMIRYCTKPGVSITGGAKRLLTYFMREHNPSSIVTYADKSLFTGLIYHNIGFTLLRESPPGFAYVNILDSCPIRLNRMKYQKHKLSRILPSYDPDKTANANMELAGYSKIYDCGQFVFELLR